jgi:hypothetical protein
MAECVALINALSRPEGSAMLVILTLYPVLAWLIFAKLKIIVKVGEPLKDLGYRW